MEPSGATEGREANNNLEKDSCQGTRDKEHVMGGNKEKSIGSSGMDICSNGPMFR
jgi:hypothetical protein